MSWQSRTPPARAGEADVHRFFSRTPKMMGVRVRTTISLLVVRVKMAANNVNRDKPRMLRNFGRKCRLGELVCNVHETLRVLCRGTHIRKRHKQDHDGVGDKVARAGFVHGPRRSALSQNTSNDHNPGNAGRSNEEKNDQNRSCRIVQKDRGLLGFGRDANGNNHKDTGQNETQQENNGSHRPLHFQG